MYQLVIKRFLDILFSVLILPLIVLLIIIIGPLIYFEDRGPVFYNAPRVGKDGKPFIMLKFRSMKVNAPDLTMSDGSTYNAPDDPRMTKIGAFLRRTSLDEMPQFLNVLIGNMSVVGPRPDLERETKLYRGNEGEKLRVKPGVTGYAAAYARNSLSWRERLAMDVYYVNNASLLFDVKIFFKTFSTVFKQEGVFVEEEDESQ